jgi:hypothetical protein
VYRKVIFFFFCVFACLTQPPSTSVFVALIRGHLFLPKTSLPSEDVRQSILWVLTVPHTFSWLWRSARYSLTPIGCLVTVHGILSRPPALSNISPNAFFLRFPRTLHGNRKVRDAPFAASFHARALAPAPSL